jgi:hypothetical protein
MSHTAIVETAVGVVEAIAAVVLLLKRRRMI